MTDRELRELDADHRVAFQETVDYAFEPEHGPTRYDAPGDTPDRLGEKLGVFENGDIRSVCTHYDFVARVRDDWLPIAGLASVSTPPEHRRQGLIRSLIVSSLNRWRTEFPIAALWPMNHAYYRQFGWAMANKAVHYTCRPSDLAFARGESTGQMRRLSPDDWQQLQAVHEAHGRDRGLTLQRDEEWWRDRIFQAIHGDIRYVYALDRKGQAEIDGYIAYRINSTGNSLCLNVDDLAFRDHDSYVRLLEFLANHDSQVETVRLPQEEETSLLDLVTNPDAIECTVSPGPQVRLVNVRQALSTISYPSDAQLTVLLDITDTHAPWNDRVFEFVVRDGAGECRPVDNAGSDEACVTTNISTLSQLFVGYHSATEAHRYANLDAPECLIADLHSVFPPQTVYLRHYF